MMASELSIQVVKEIGAIPADDWNGLVSPNDPFTRHGFLRALEESNSVGPGTGWLPCHVAVYEEEKLVGAVPLYLKSNSYGEYIFDWGWAGASQRAGLPYYPKLVSSVPFTPATGRRLLVHDGALDGPVFDALVSGVQAVADRSKAHSIHFLFCTFEEREALADRHSFLPRLTMQFHWQGAGDQTFDDYLGRMRASTRKQIRRERRQAMESGLTIHTRSGDAFSDDDWSSLYRFYRNTTGRKGAYDYLTEDFFLRIRETYGEHVVMSMAKDGERPVAASLSFEAGQHLYGRYWGADEFHEGLHFELCYYQLIERSIAKGHTRFEAGAQGPHKIKRGLLPSATYSAHWLRHEGLFDAVASHLLYEKEATEEEMEMFAAHSPYKKGKAP
ncbi:MAG: GNAT family N-acetyltransferase [Myxococcales bacterium]|nr:GNAT family N-acetyltransferase [Myxococcales bacterium]